MAAGQDVLDMLARLRASFEGRGFQRSQVHGLAGEGVRYAKGIVLSDGVAACISVEFFPNPRSADNPGYAIVQAERDSLPGERTIYSGTTPVAKPIFVTFAAGSREVSKALADALEQIRRRCAEWVPPEGALTPAPGRPGTYAVRP